MLKIHQKEKGGRKRDVNNIYISHYFIDIIIH